MMQRAHRLIKNSSGLSFYKLMGSGKGRGFNPLPDWSVYALLQVWESEKAAELFLGNNELIERYRKKSEYLWTIFMKPVRSNGSWAGSNPFKVSDSLDHDNKPIAVITRATIKWSKMFKFWRFVPKSQQPLTHAKGLIYTKGIGEVPLVQMATFSLWKCEDDLFQFAYGSEEHKEAINLTRKLGWYKEELFARFQPYKSYGDWPNIKLGWQNFNFNDVKGHSNVL